MPLTAPGLTKAIEKAFADEWFRLRQTPLPAAGGDDRRMLFVAVATGVLAYLSSNQDDFINSITFEQNAGDSWSVDAVDLNIT